MTSLHFSSGRPGGGDQVIWCQWQLPNPGALHGSLALRCQLWQMRSHVALHRSCARCVSQCMSAPHSTTYTVASETQKA